MAKIFDDRIPFNIFARTFIIDVWQGFKYASEQSIFRSSFFKVTLELVKDILAQSKKAKRQIWNQIFVILGLRMNVLTQLTLNCSKSRIKALEKDVKYTSGSLLLFLNNCYEKKMKTNEKVLNVANPEFQKCFF